jgi:multidrug efflux system membrane fusion protein
MTAPRRSTHIDLALGLAAALALGLGLGGCGKGDAAAQRGRRPPVAVTAGTAETRDVPVDVGAVGSVEAWNTVDMTAQVGGVIQEVRFTEGQDVKEGDVLFVIDPRPYRAALDQALANLARDSATAATAKANAERYAGLVQKDYVTQQQADDMASAAAAARATVRADSASVENARLNLDYCTLRAPLSGRTGSLLVHAGNLVKANGDQPLVVINQITPVRVAFSVPERELPRIRAKGAAADLPVMVTLPDSSVTVTGTLSFVDNTVDETTGTVLLKATVPNRDRALWPGQFVDVSLRLGTEPHAVVVPSSAVQSGQQGSFVYIIKPDRTVEMRPVTAGSQVDGFTVVKTGVKSGEEVVTDGQLRLVPGASVSIKSAPADSADGAGA